jgi:hypothetical protein
LARFVVMEPDGAFAADAPVRARIIRDGFSFMAFLVPPLWLAWHRLWVEAAIAFALMLGLALLGEHAGLGWTAPLLSLLLSLLIGLEGQALVVAGLARRGWRERIAIEAGDLDDAEQRYAAWLAAAPGEEAQRPDSDLLPPAGAPVATRPASRARGLLLSTGRA